MRSGNLRWKASTVLICLIGAIAAHAQLTEGTIVGNVTDPSGAVLSGAKVSVRNVGTDATVELTTDDIGYYRAAHLAPGTYEIRVEKPGFKVAILDNVHVSVNFTTRSDVTLLVGSTQESVTVSESVTLVQTEEARLSGTITTQEITELPLNGRQIYQLVTLQPGVTATTAPVISSVPSPTSAVTFDFGFIANGSNPRANNFILDGNSNNNEWLGGQPLIYPSLEAVEEMQVQTLNFSAEYGRNSGAIVHVVTKAGTNDLHGSTFYSTRNSSFDAANAFDQPGQKSPLHLHQFGFSLGGPVIKDKTFFFLNYEGSRLSEGLPSLVITETPAFRQDVFTRFPNSIAALFFHDFPGPACIPGTEFSTGSVSTDPNATNPILGPFLVGPVNPAQNDKCSAIA
ncbi:MAG: carboxypeptidase regulatory-like domain-containing protein, partial [Acidobacteriales bacterium]|nr:carboxypeptidase regulatory-like domain-containing protein [Terriglobales bacterium]